MGCDVTLLSECSFVHVLYEIWYDSYVKGRYLKFVTADVLKSAFMSTTDAQACEVWRDTGDTSDTSRKGSKVVMTFVPAVIVWNVVGTTQWA